MKNNDLTAEMYQYIITPEETAKIEDGEYYNYVLKTAVMKGAKLSLEKKKIIDFSWEISGGDTILIFYYHRHF